MEIWQSNEGTWSQQGTKKGKAMHGSWKNLSLEDQLAMPNTNQKHIRLVKHICKFWWESYASGWNPFFQKFTCGEVVAIPRAPLELPIQIRRIGRGWQSPAPVANFYACPWAFPKPEHLLVPSPVSTYFRHNTLVFEGFASDLGHSVG